MIRAELSATTPEQAAAETLLEVSGLVVDLPGRAGAVRVVDGVSFDIPPATTVGLIGESGQRQDDDRQRADRSAP